MPNINMNCHPVMVNCLTDPVTTVDCLTVQMLSLSHHNNCQVSHWPCHCTLFGQLQNKHSRTGQHYSRSLSWVSESYRYRRNPAGNIPDGPNQMVNISFNDPNYCICIWPASQPNILMSVGKLPLWFTWNVPNAPIWSEHIKHISNIAKPSE